MWPSARSSSRPPVLNVPTNQTLSELTTLVLTNTATDADLPANTLTFSLLSAPAGMTLNPSTGYVVSTSGSGVQFGNAHITATGSGPDIGFTCALGFPQQCRWGDYSWSTLDPNGKDLWMAGELTVPQVATQPKTKPPAKTNWGTQVWDVAGQP